MGRLFKGLVVVQVFLLLVLLVERFAVRSVWPLQWFALKQSFKQSFAAEAEAGAEAVVPMEPYRYEVRAADTYWSLSKVFGVAIDSIISHNNPERPHALGVGDWVEIPIVNGIFHEFRGPEETIAMVSADYNVSLELLQYFNPELGGTGRVFVPGAAYSLSERNKRLGYLFMKPLKEMRLTSAFGMRIHPITKRREFHYGIDLGAPRGTPVFSSKSGRVSYAGASFGYGNLVVIRHSSRYSTKYAHLDSIGVRVGQRVGVQEPIGTIGSTGRSTGYHLHFEVVRDGSPINPLDVTSFK